MHNNISLFTFLWVGLLWAFYCLSSTLVLFVDDLHSELPRDLQTSRMWVALSFEGKFLGIAERRPVWGHTYALNIWNLWESKPTRGEARH